MYIYIPFSCYGGSHWNFLFSDNPLSRRNWFKKSSVHVYENIIKLDMLAINFSLSLTKRIYRIQETEIESKVISSKLCGPEI